MSCSIFQPMAADATIIVKPQPGPQEAFLASGADIVIYGGAAGGGKTYALLLECLRAKHVSGFGAVIFRREAVQITNEGGLWDSALNLYPKLGGRPFKSPKLGFEFDRSKITFGHLTRDIDVLDFQGAQIPLIAFDELTHFTRHQFFYMLSRNRSTCGVRPYVRATTNPDAQSWVADFISWWIDQETGFPIECRSGVVRWFVRIDDRLYWGDDPAALCAEHGVPDGDAKSVTFIHAKVTDNRILLSVDPGYLSNLKALSYVERARLLDGNWKVKPAAGLYFPRHAANLIDAAPADSASEVRSWDLAATPASQSTPSPSATAGVRMAKYANGRYLVRHVEHLREAAHRVRQAIQNTARQDGHSVRITLPQDPGQAGKDQGQSLVALLAGYPVSLRRPSSDKITRAEPFAAQWQAGNVDVLRSSWTEAFLAELEAFPDGCDDQVDAASDAFATLSRGGTGYAATLRRTIQ